jgi:hypothetical protein
MREKRQMKLNDLDGVNISAAMSLPASPPAAGWRGSIAALKARLVKAWVGLYAAPPRRALPSL